VPLSTAPGLRGLFDWAFRSRQSGRVAIVQLPNLPLTLFLALRGVEALLPADGRARTALHWAGTAALVWWAGEEVLRGVSPFRRALGAAVLLVILVG